MGIFNNKQEAMDVAIPYNPFQGLKPLEGSVLESFSESLPEVAIPYNPFQGLKLVYSSLALLEKGRNTL